MKDKRSSYLPNNLGHRKALNIYGELGSEEKDKDSSGPWPASAGRTVDSGEGGKAAGLLLSELPTSSSFT